MRTPEPKINDYDICYDYIVRCRYYLEDHWTLDEEDLERKITNAEIDLMEMETQMIADVEEYDSLMNRNAFRTAKRAQRRKANIRYSKSDRKHGKPVPQSDKKYWDEQSGTYYRWDEKRKTFSSPKKPIVHRKRKTFRDRLNSAMDARELDYTSDFSEKGELMDKVEFLDEAISFGEREIENLEYEKAFGYLSDRGDIVIEECKRNLSELKDYKRDILRVIRTATR
jgi:hypothetical protein